MPVSPALAENLAAEVVGHYQEAERQLLERISRNLAKGIDGPHWAEQKYAQLLAYQRQTERLIADLKVKAKTGVDTAITQAYDRGGLSAVSDMSSLGVTPVEHLAGLRAVEAMAAETLGYVSSTHPRILRSTMDAYRAAIEAGSKQAFVGSMERVAASEAARTIVAENAQQVLLGATTRRQATQATLNAFAKKGITGFIDKSGRGWNLESYVETAMRTGCGKAAVQGHVDRLVENGLDLVIVSDAPRECPLCLVAGTVVEGPAVEYRCRLEYSGDLISISTASGKHLSGTPDHTVLTPGGWRRLKDLHPGDEVVSNGGQEWHTGIVPDYEQVPTLIEEAGKLRAPLLLSGPARRHLDSDVTYREVHVVAPNGLLRDEGNAALAQPPGDLSLIGRVGLSAQRLRHGDLAARLFGVMRAAPSVMRRRDHLPALLWSRLSPAFAEAGAAHGGAFVGREASHVLDDSAVLGAGGYAGPPQVVTHHPTADAECGAELLRALTGNVAPDKIVGLSVTQFTGHVWDLQTGPSWYAANGIISHNCRPWEGKVLSIGGPYAGAVDSAFLAEGQTTYPTLDEARAAGFQHVNCRHNVSAYQEGITRPMTNTEDPEGYAATQKLRYLERNVRQSKRMEAAAGIDPEALAKATRRKLDYQAKIRTLTATTTAKRQPYRESLGVTKAQLAKLTPKP